MKRHSPFQAIFAAGLICGILDGLSAIAAAAYSGVGPIRVFQGIASGLVGRSSFQGGIGTALLGLALHFVVATGAATVYYFAGRSLPILIDRALICASRSGL
jgi:hypothetical protein